MIREAWERVREIKDSVGMPGQRADRRSVGRTYDEGEAWVRTVLDAAGLGSEAEIDELTTVVNDNGRVTLHNLLSIDRTQLRETAITAGLAKPSDPQAVVVQLMFALLMHSSGFANGLALGLLLRRP